MVIVLITAPILQHCDHDWEVVVQADTSDDVSADVSAQYDNVSFPHPVAYFWMSHKLAECNCMILDK
jgi:hypothetical protein